MNNSRAVKEREKIKAKGKTKIPSQALNLAKEFAKSGNLNVHLLSLKMSGNEELANKLRGHPSVQTAISEGIQLREAEKKGRKPKKKKEKRINKLKEKGNVSILKSKKSIYLTPSELKVLRYIEEKKGNVTYNKIQKDTGVSQGMISKALAKLREGEHPIVGKMRRMQGGIRNK